MFLSSLVAPNAPTQVGECRFTDLCIVPDMNRQEVEKRIARMQGRHPQATGQGRHLAGGVVEYRHGSCIMRVTYRHDQAAHWAQNCEQRPEAAETVLQKVEHCEIIEAGAPAA